MNPFKYSDDNKRYHTLDYYYKHKYNSKVFKVSLNIGCSCPNIDGVKGYGGCIYCKNGSGDFAGRKTDPLNVQFNNIKNMMLKKWPNAKYIAYFQAGTNTYGDLNYLKSCFEEVLTYDNVVGINIATRPDAISDECLKYLCDLNKRTDLVIELGLQTIHDKTAKFINRGYDLECFYNTFMNLKNNNIKVVVHIIDGLPYEDEEMMIETVKYLNKLGIFGIKIHMLHILKGTALEKIYENKPFHVLEKDEYVKIVCNQLLYLDPNVVINRITGDPNIDDLVEPYWLVKKFTVLNEIDKYQVKHDIYQGKGLLN